MSSSAQCDRNLPQRAFSAPCQCSEQYYIALNAQTDNRYDMPTITLANGDQRYMAEKRF